MSLSLTMFSRLERQGANKRRKHIGKEIKNFKHSATVLEQKGSVYTCVQVTHDLVHASILYSVKVANLTVKTCMSHCKQIPGVERSDLAASTVPVSASVHAWTQHACW